MFTVYGYDKCGTCRNALKWLAAHRVPHVVRAIRQTPPSEAELREALGCVGGDIRKLFNTSGSDYRELGIKDLLPGMSEARIFELLSTHGNLVKRPFLIGGGKVLVGFKPAAWQDALL